MLEVYTVVLNNTEDRALDYLYRKGIDYLIVARDGQHTALSSKCTFNRVLLTITAGRVSKIEFR